MLLKGWYSLRGGSHYYWPALARASYRSRLEPSARDGDVGVRCARSSRR